MRRNDEQNEVHVVNSAGSFLPPSSSYLKPLILPCCCIIIIRGESFSAVIYVGIDLLLCLESPTLFLSFCLASFNY